MVETIDLYEAVREMRRLTAKGTPFSLVHATWNRDTHQSEGIRRVSTALLRPQAKGDDVANADHKLFYTDVDNRLQRICWQPLIMFFNEKKVILN